jgi:hypothetical protein
MVWEVPCPILAVIQSERSESKDLHLGIYWRKGGKPRKHPSGTVKML